MGRTVGYARIRGETSLLKESKLGCTDLCVPVVAVGQKARRWKKQLHDYFIPSFQEDNGSHLSVKNRYKATYIAAENAS
jgi:hypothetical protein